MDYAAREKFVGFMKTSKIGISYTERDGALRINLLNKVGVSAQSDPCSDGSANCGDVRLTEF